MLTVITRGLLLYLQFDQIISIFTEIGKTISYHGSIENPGNCFYN